ncbi:phosphonate metabolism transcriptional regulator PhnF [Phenylobacterium sp.]|uniref:phosphonate metabolism transcriptional regulator PhnF n=1 Tax=Phenylobacterium sp. TaxID=1871053 RepID=UPI0035B38642
MALNLPLWREISQSLERRIATKELCPGDKLPTEYELSREFMVNRHTVRRALSYLQDKGIVESTQGRGSFVRRPSRPARLIRRPRFTDAVMGQGREPSTKTLKLDVRPADAKVAGELGLKPGKPVIFLERIRFIDGEPVGLSLHYLSFERFPTFVEMYRARGSITHTLIDSGVPDYTRRRTLISARLPTAQESEQLRVPRHVPLLIRRYLNVDGLGRPLEYGEGRGSQEVVIEFADTARDDGLVGE